MAAINEDPVAFEDLLMEARPRGPCPPLPPQSRLSMQDLRRHRTRKPITPFMAGQRKKPGYDPAIAGGEGQYRVTPPLDVTGHAPPIPEEVTAEQLAAARERMATAEKASAIPMAFVPRTLADYRFQVRELERALVGAETQEEKAAIIDQLRNTMETARGAVDVQPDGLIEAVTGVAGKKAQKVAFEGMSTGEKEFLKQMYDASKEKRDAAREGRAVAKEAHEAEMRPLRKRKLDAEMKRAEKRLRSGAGSKQLKGADRAILAHGANFIQDHQHYKNKTGPYSDDELVSWLAPDAGLTTVEKVREDMWKRRAGPLINADIDTLEMDMNVAGLSSKGGKVADKSIKALRGEECQGPHAATEA